jgi:hypothetical protein
MQSGRATPESETRRRSQNQRSRRRSHARSIAPRIVARCPPHTCRGHSAARPDVSRRVVISNLPAAGVLAVAMQFRHRSRALAVVSTVLAARACETTAALMGALAIRALLCHGMLLRRAEPTAPKEHATVGPVTTRPLWRAGCRPGPPGRHVSRRRCATASINFATADVRFAVRLVHWRTRVSKSVELTGRCHIP